MPREELKTRCTALAGIGDTAAAATLVALEELDGWQKRAEMSQWHWQEEVTAREKRIGELEDELAKQAVPLPGALAPSEKLKKQAEDFRYVVDKIKTTLTLADTLLQGCTLTRDTVPGVRTDDLTTVKDGLKTAPEDGVKVAAAATRETIAEFQGVLLNGRPIGDAPPAEPARVPQPQPMAERGRSPDVTPQATPEESRAVAALAKEFGVSDNEARAVVRTRKNMGLPPAMDAAVIQNVPTGPAGAYDKGPKKDPVSGE
jgi:hypothetical protein